MGYFRHGLENEGWEKIENADLRDALRAFAASAEHLRDVWENLHGLSPDHDAMCVGYPTSWESFEDVARLISIWCDSALTGEDPVKWYGGDVA